MALSRASLRATQRERSAATAGGGPAAPARTGRNLLRFMAMMRAAEERGVTLYRQGKVPGTFYDGCGQEAISVGSAFALGPSDRMCILHRDLGAHFVRGVTPDRYLANYMGRSRRRHRRQGRQHALRRPRARLRRHGLDAARHGAGRHAGWRSRSRCAASRASR